MKCDFNEDTPIIINYLKKQSLTGGEIKYIINKMSNVMRRYEDQPCKDNYRFSFKDDTERMKKYNEILHCGCCGFCDEEIILNNGRVLVFGFNFGH